MKKWNPVVTGKIIRCSKLKNILDRLPKQCFLNTSAITGDIIVMSNNYEQIGYIDLLSDEYIEYP